MTAPALNLPAVSLSARHPKVPAPKFQCFDQVRHKGSVYTVCGMSYISAIVALVEDIKPGWRYALRAESGIGKSPEDCLEANFEEIAVRECHLEAA